MRHLVTAFLLGILSLPFLFPHQATAAVLRGGDHITVASEEGDLRNVYIGGGTIRVDAPISEDLVIGGGEIRVTQPVSGSILAAGGTVRLEGDVAKSVRVAGGNIYIDGNIAHDLAIAGGSVTVSKDASIAGDVLFLGGQLILEGPVGGKIIGSGGEVRINTNVGNNVEVQVGNLTVGPQTTIAGDLVYASSEKATIQQGASIGGKTQFRYIPQQEPANKGILTFGALYKLIADILISMIYIFFLAAFIQRLFNRMTTSPLKSGGIGFAYIILFPLAGLLFLTLLWLGLASFLFYGLTLLISVYLAKVFVGWFLLRWYEKRKKHAYTLDWKAGIVGPIALFILLLIPVFGWLVVLLLFFVSSGALMQELVAVAAHQKVRKKTAHEQG